MNVVNVNLEGYKKVWDELSVCDQILMKGENIITEALEDEVVKITHKGYMGIV